MNGHLRGFSKLGAFVLLIAVLTFTGCSDNTLLGPEPTGTSQLDRIVLQNQSLQEATAVETEKLVNPETGDVLLIDREDYQHSFLVEPGGIDEYELITIKSNKEIIGLKSAITFEFGPEGLVFNEASKLEFEMAEINAEARTARLYYLDPRVGEWVLQSEKEVRDGVVVFEIYHFSKYAISD